MGKDERSKSWYIVKKLGKKERREKTLCLLLEENKWERMQIGVK